MCCSFSLSQRGLEKQQKLASGGKFVLETITTQIFVELFAFLSSVVCVMVAKEQKCCFYVKQANMQL
jgi:hypothetical protein